MNNEYQRSIFEAWIRDIPVHDRTPWIVWQAAVTNNNSDTRKILIRCVTGLDHLLAVALLWEPHYASTPEKRGINLANEARNTARAFLGDSK
jgi:hypothetical protein